MLKKLLLWSMYSVLLGLLLAGAMYRTSVKLEDGEQNQGHGNQSRQENSGTGNGQFTNEPTIANADVEEHEHETKEASIVASQVVDLSNRGITLKLTSGPTVSLTGRAWRYAQALGFSTQVSDTLWLEGFYEGDSFEIMRMTNLEANQSISLRDETGHPLWNGN